MSEPDRFEACLAEVLRHEGGYADHPADPGGATNMGITRRTLAAWRRVSPWQTLPKAAVKALDRDEAAAIYYSLYWRRCRCGDLPAGLDLAVFDFAVSSGPARGVRTLQAILGVATDGIAGPVTLEAIAARTGGQGVGALIGALCDRRLGFLRALATFTTFGRGWTARVAAVRATALRMAGSVPPPSTPSTEPRRQTMDFLSGYRTYIVAALMLLAALAQFLGVDLPALDGQSAGQLLMESLAIIFLRRGIKSDIAKS